MRTPDDTPRLAARFAPVTPPPPEIDYRDPATVVLLAACLVTWFAMGFMAAVKWGVH